MAQIGIIGGGPAGLIAAEVLSARGHAVTVLEAMPTVGRKFLMAGKSGLNISHGEPHEALAGRFGAAGERLRVALDGFTAAGIRDWCAGLGIETFVGSSGRVFPTSMKGSPLLRAWLARLEKQGVVIRKRHRWQGFSGDDLVFTTPEGQQLLHFDAILLALGGASWPRLGSDGQWAPWLAERGIAVAPFLPANCGFETEWSPFLVERFAGEPVKNVTATSNAEALEGEFVVTRWGVEGSLVYTHSAALRDQIAAEGLATLTLDLVPQRSHERLAADLERQPPKASFGNRLRKGAGLNGIKAALVRECVPEAAGLAPPALAAQLKALPLTLLRTRPLAEAISSAGGITLSSIDNNFMLSAIPGLFAAGEMLDWEAPTGGYLLTASMATGRAAAEGIDRFLAARG